MSHHTISANLYGAGTLDASAIAGANALTVGGYAGTSGTTLANLSAPAGTLNVGGDFDVATTFTHNNGTVVFGAGLGSSSNSQTWNPGQVLTFNYTWNQRSSGSTEVARGFYDVTFIDSDTGVSTVPLTIQLTT